MDKQIADMIHAYSHSEESLQAKRMGEWCRWCLKRSDGL